MIWTVVGIVVFTLLAVFVGLYFKDAFETFCAVLRRPRTGREALCGRTVGVKTALTPEGTMSLEGELWKAISQEGDLLPGAQVRVTKVDSLKLYVTREK